MTLISLTSNSFFTAISCFFVLTLAWVFRGVYRKWPLDIIESSCILYLGLLAVVTNYVVKDNSNQNIQTAVVNVSVGAVFVPLIVILGYQAYKQLTTSVFWQRCVSSLSIRKSESQQCFEEPIANQADVLTPDLEPEQASNVTEQLLPPVIHFDKYREPVLEYEDENA